MKKVFFLLPFLLYSFSNAYSTEFSTTSNIQATLSHGLAKPKPRGSRHKHKPKRGDKVVRTYRQPYGKVRMVSGRVASIL